MLRTKTNKYAVPCDYKTLFENIPRKFFIIHSLQVYQHMHIKIIHTKDLINTKPTHIHLYLKGVSNI